jgi:serine/threonine protein kinase
MTPASTGDPQPLSPFLSLCEGDLLGGRYRIESLQASRASVVHFEATDLTTGTRVSAAVLVSQAGSLGDPDEDSARVAFLAGARRAKALTSPHVAQVLDAGVTFEGHPWIVRAHLASMTLAAHLRQHGALPTSEAVDVSLAVCDAIAEAHASGILHGSLGPHAVHVAFSASGLADIKVTGTGTASTEAKLALGTTGDVECILRSPEQLHDGFTVDGRADVWAIGVLLHTMLAGAPPFAADTPSGASLSVILDDPPSLAGVPDELADVVERALAKDASARPSTVLELAEAIVCFASHPDFARDRIASRLPPAFAVLPSESDPTLVMHRPPFASVSELQTSSENLAPRVDSSIPPAIHDLGAQPVFHAPPPPPAPSFTYPRMMGKRDLPTVITKRPDKASFLRRRTLRALGFITAAASVALLVLVGTEGSRISHKASALTHGLQHVMAKPPPPVAPIPAPKAIETKPVEATPALVYTPSSEPVTSASAAPAPEPRPSLVRVKRPRP